MQRRAAAVMQIRISRIEGTPAIFVVEICAWLLVEKHQAARVYTEIRVGAEISIRIIYRLRKSA
jgi:hypothetical protein